MLSDILLMFIWTAELWMACDHRHCWSPKWRTQKCLRASHLISMRFDVRAEYIFQKGWIYPMPQEYYWNKSTFSWSFFFFDKHLHIVHPILVYFFLSRVTSFESKQECFCVERNVFPKNAFNLWTKDITVPVVAWSRGHESCQGETGQQLSFGSAIFSFSAWEHVFFLSFFSLSHGALRQRWWLFWCIIATVFFPRLHECLLKLIMRKSQVTSDCSFSTISMMKLTGSDAAQTKWANWC